MRIERVFDNDSFYSALRKRTKVGAVRHNTAADQVDDEVVAWIREAFGAV